MGATISRRRIKNISGDILHRKHLEELDKSRQKISATVRELRRERQLTQRKLSELIGISQGNLSNLERGDGSFTAEQLLLLMKIFNVPISHFAGPLRLADPYIELQNALARIGAGHLREDDTVLPSERFDETTRIVREAILLGVSRHLTALAPILVRQGNWISLPRLDSDLRNDGFERRLPWLTENILAALTQQRSRTLPRELSTSYRRAEIVLGEYLQMARWRLDTQPFDHAPYDILDPTIRSKRTLDDVIARASEISQRWRIATGLRPDDFATALEAANAGD